MATKAKGMKKRDSYRSQLYPDTAVPQGVGAASMDLGNALSLIEDWIEREEWQSQEVQITPWPQERTLLLIEVIEIAIQAWKQSVNPALLVYDRLQQNAEQAQIMFQAAALAEQPGEAERWGIVGGVLVNTLRDKAMVPRSVMSMAQRLIREADEDDNLRASTLIQAITEQAEAAAAALEEKHGHE